MVDIIDDSRAPVGAPTEPPTEPPTRRRFLAMAAGGLATVAVVAAVAGDVHAARSGVFASGSGPAYEPWQNWDRGTVPLSLVSAAVLAANAHNAQAWRFTAAPGRIEVYDDVSRSLGAVDAFRREIHISAGCALENIVLAAGAGGLVPRVTLRPTGDPALLARVDLAPGASTRSELYAAIPLRHTDRGAYQTGRELAADVPTDIDALVREPDVRIQWLLSSAQRAAFSDLTVAATEAFIADTRQSSDDYAWYRRTPDQILAHRDGVTADAGGLSPLVRTLGKLIPASPSSNNAYWLAGTRDRQLPTASGFAIIEVRDAGDVAQRLDTGRLYQRLHLWATTRGLAVQPLNQTVERAERERATTGADGRIGAGLTGLVDDPTWQPVMPFRIGYPTVAATASPRRDVRDVVVSAP